MGHTHRYQFDLGKKSGKESQYMVSHPELGSDSPIGSDRESGRDKLVSEHRYTLTSGLLGYDTNTSWYQSLGLGVYGRVFD